MIFSNPTNAFQYFLLLTFSAYHAIIIMSTGLCKCPVTTSKPFLGFFIFLGFFCFHASFQTCSLVATFTHPASFCKWLAISFLLVGPSHATAGIHTAGLSQLTAEAAYYSLSVFHVVLFYPSFTAASHYSDELSQGLLSLHCLRGSLAFLSTCARSLETEPVQLPLSVDA